MKFQRESGCAKLFEEMVPLFQKHYEEIAHFKDIPLEPDFDQYEKIESLGMLRVYTAREDDGSIVGYCVYFIKYNPHYKSSLNALQDILFIDPTKRGFGAKFILWCDKQLTDEGVQLVYQHIKAKHNFGPMLERMGYELVDLMYCKRLDGGN